MESNKIIKDKKLKLKKDICLLNNINSKYILEIIFGDLAKNKTLKIVKHNKKIKDRLEITNKDYKEYSQIKIEIIPAPNIYGKFINIPIDEEKYFYIYFDNNKEKIKNNLLTSKDIIKKIRVVILSPVVSFLGLFEDCECIQSITFTHFYRNNITNMSRMFSWCRSLKEVNFSIVNSKNVTDMSCMFAGCTSLKKIKFGDFNTSNVTDMSDMFCSCYSLRELDVSNFKTNNVIYMNGMFNGCSSLIDLNLINFNMNKAINTEDMFNGCPAKLALK